MRTVCLCVIESDPQWHHQNVRRHSRRRRRRRGCPYGMPTCQQAFAFEIFRLCFAVVAVDVVASLAVRYSSTLRYCLCQTCHRKHTYHTITYIPRNQPLIMSVSVQNRCPHQHPKHPFGPTNNHNIVQHRFQCLCVCMLHPLLCHLC